MKEVLQKVRKFMAFGCGLAVAGAAMANTVYVSAENGDDETDDGSQERPMKTIQAGSTNWSVIGLQNSGSTMASTNLTGQFASAMCVGWNCCIVRSMSGNPAEVVIDGLDKVRCIECRSVLRKTGSGCRMRSTSRTTRSVRVRSRRWCRQAFGFAKMSMSSPAPIVETVRSSRSDWFGADGSVCAWKGGCHRGALGPAREGPWAGRFFDSICVTSQDKSEVSLKLKLI